MDDYNALRQLKARYCQRLDDKDWAGFGELFLDDATWSYAGAGVDPPTSFTGREEIVQHMVNELANVTSAHHVTSSDLEILNDTQARGRWGAFFMQGGSRLIGCGTYREEYVKTADGWRFRTIKVEQTMITITQQAALIP
jgi:hypothetical protein